MIGLGWMLGRGWALPCAVGLLAASAHAPLSAQGTAPADLAACVAAGKQAFSELVQAQDGEVRRHVMHPVLVARLQGLGSRLTALRGTVARKPRNLAECETTRAAITEAREQLERIAGSPAQAAECTAANKLAFSELQTALLGLQTGGKAAPLAVEAAAGRLDLLRTGLARELPSLADCKLLAGEIEGLRAEVQRLVPVRPAAAAQPAAAPAPAAANLAASAVQATACRETQARAYNEVAQTYARLVGSASIPVEWMAPLQALSERIRRLGAAIADAAAPGWDCEATARGLAQARAELVALEKR